METDTDLRPCDEALLDLLADGRVTAPLARDETGYALQYIRDRFAWLVERGFARRVHDNAAMYELVEDPRGDR